MGRHQQGSDAGLGWAWGLQLQQPGGEGEEACGGDPFLCQGSLVGKVDSICVPAIGKGLTTAKLHRRGGLGGRD